jgi:hypothetical protein
LEVTRQRCEADHPPPSVAEVKKVGAIPPLPHTYSWADAKLIKLKDNFTLPLTVSISNNAVSPSKESPGRPIIVIWLGYRMWRVTYAY